jgi:hypothetical protein
MSRADEKSSDAVDEACLEVVDGEIRPVAALDDLATPGPVRVAATPTTETSVVVATPVALDPASVAATPTTETSVVVATPVAPGPADNAISSAITRRRRGGLFARARWLVRVHLHRLRAATKSLRWWSNNLVFVIVWGMIGWPMFKTNTTHSIFYVLGLVAMKFGVARRLASSSAMQLVPRGYLERKGLLYRLVLESRRHAEFAPAQVERHQREVLELIAMYVRSHREDASANEIFVNLLVEDGDDMVVVARDRDHRKPVARYPKEKMIVAVALDRGTMQCTGDVAKEWGIRDRTYRSILAIPVRSENRILGVVSIDSTRANHFDIECEELERFLAPYIALLVWTLERNVAMSGHLVKLTEGGGER